MKTLAQYHNYLEVSKTVGGYAITNGIGWEKYATSYFVSETYFDLGGLTKDDKTLMIDAATVQRGATHSSSQAGAGDYFVIWDVMTSIPINITSTNIVNLAQKGGYGFPGDGNQLNFEHVLYQRMQRFAFDLDFQNAIPVLVDNVQSGSLEPTASDRIYCYRIVLMESVGDSLLTIAPARLLINANTKEEPTYEYLMRLKRSYDLQQSLDRD